MTEPAGMYVHIPFCVRKCPYCDFYSVSDLSLTTAFAEALEKEIRMVSANVSFPFDTIYFGGGTPSVIDPDMIRGIVRSAFRFFEIRDQPEITIEVNPGTVSLEKLRNYRSSGINRLNIGVQSFLDDHLKFLGRIHSAEEARLAVEWARNAGFDNIGLDLIYGLPGQTADMWISDMETALEFDPEHLSCYMLTYEQGTPMDTRRQANMFCPADEETLADLFLITGEFLKKHGYLRYEISNFARSEFLMSRHNRKYWNNVPYLGFGPSAHSFIEPERFRNPRSVKQYVGSIEAGKLPIEEREVLTCEQQITEFVYLGLRQRVGLDMNGFGTKFGLSFEKTFGNIAKTLEKNGLAHIDEGYFALTEKGMLVSDSIVLRMLNDRIG